MTISVEHFEEAIICARNLVADDDEQRDQVEGNYERLMRVIRIDVLAPCVLRFLDAEFDTNTPGDRGLGRMTTEVPRLGAYFRKQLAALSSGESEDLERHLEVMIAAGYLSACIFADKHAGRSLSIGSEQLCEKWIPSIYSGQLDQRTVQLTVVVGQDAMEATKSFFEQHAMCGGGAFREDKTDSILVHYLVAGFLLRYCEVA